MQKLATEKFHSFTSSVHAMANDITSHSVVGDEPHPDPTVKWLVAFAAGACGRKWSKADAPSRRIRGRFREKSGGGAG
jgi:hypothetical protein